MELDLIDEKLRELRGKVVSESTLVLNLRRDSKYEYYRVLKGDVSEVNREYSGKDILTVVLKANPGAVILYHKVIDREGIIHQDCYYVFTNVWKEYCEKPYIVPNDD